MQPKHSMLICMCILVPTTNTPISIVNGAKSLVSKVTNTFQKGVSSALPDVVIRWEDEDREKTLQEAQVYLDQFAHTTASELKTVVQDLDAKADHKIDATTHHLNSLLERLDTIIHNNTDHAADNLIQVVSELETVIQHFQQDLNYTIDDINDRLYNIIDRAIARAQLSVGQAIRQAGYTLGGVGAACIGACIFKQALIDAPDDIQPTRQYHKYASALALIGTGFFLTDESESLAQNGISGYTYNTGYKLWNTIPAI